MSKTSKPADRWRQMHASAHDRHPDYCHGCGYYPVANHGNHRPDCTCTCTNKPQYPVMQQSPP